MICVHSKNKELLTSLRAAMYNFDEELVRLELEKLIDPDAKIRMPFPFKDLIGPQAFLQLAILLYLMLSQIWKEEIGL